MIKKDIYLKQLRSFWSISKKKNANLIKLKIDGKPV